MAIKSKIKIANNLVKSEDGYYEGVITKASFGQGMRTEKIGKDTEQIPFDRFELYCEFPGSDKPMKIPTFTGTSINSEPIEVKYAGRGKANEIPVYNRFTMLLMALGLIEESELVNVDEKTVEKIEQDLENLKDQMIRCKISKDKGGFNVIDLGSLEMKK